MDREYIKNAKEKLLEIRTTLKEEKRIRLANGIAAAATIAILPFAIIDSFSYGPTSGYFVTFFVIVCASSNSVFFYKSQKSINQGVVDFKNIRNEYNSQKILKNKANH
jgi:hypothetical protein